MGVSVLFTETKDMPGSGGEEGVGVLWLIYAGYVRCPLRIRLLHYSLFCGHIIDPILVTLGKK